MAWPISVTVIINLYQHQHMFAHFVTLNRQHRRLDSTMWTRCTYAYLTDFDFCLLVMVESFSTTFPSVLFPLHDAFIVSGVKLNWCLNSPTFWESGSIDYLIRKELGKYIEQVKVEYDNIIVIKLSKDLLGTNTPIVLLWYKYTNCPAWSLFNSLQFN